MLSGIVILFIVCHVGEIFIAVYEMTNMLDGEKRRFPTW